MFWIKVVFSALVIAGVSELGKKYSVIAAILASLPLVSILAIGWLYIETGDRYKVAELTTGILWAILPSLVFFISLPMLLKTDLNFYLALLISAALTFGGYLIYLAVLKKFGMNL